MLYVSHCQEELLVSSQHLPLCRVVFYPGRTAMDFDEAIQWMSKDFSCPCVTVAFSRSFFQRPHNTAVLGEPPQEPLHGATPATELPVVKMFPRSTTLTQVFHKDRSPKNLWPSTMRKPHSWQKNGNGWSVWKQRHPTEKHGALRAPAACKAWYILGERVPRQTATS